MDWGRIQSRLRQLGFDPGPIDGIAGRLTRAAVRRFQAADGGLEVDGIVGAQTMAALFGPSDPQIDDVDLPWWEEAQRLRGVTETAGRANNPTIMGWAEDLHLGYVGDDVPWCGLFTAHCIASTLPGEPLPTNPLGARQWLKFGRPLDEPAIGAVLVFWRGSRAGWHGHVGFCAGVDRSAFHVLGGNQANAVNVRRVARERLLGIRWPVSSVVEPLAIGEGEAGGVASSDGDEA